MKRNVIKTVLAGMICFYMACSNDVYAEQENTEGPGNVPTNERQIDISQLPAGVYFAVFYTKEMSVTKKIIVK